MAISSAALWIQLDDDEEDELIEFVRREYLDRALASSRRQGFWFHVTPEFAAPLRDQGWKLHVSATTSSAEAILRAVTPIFFEEGVAFKFAALKRLLRVLNSSQAPRGSSGKFITIYPKDDAQAVTLARKCHAATHAMDGPTILSDRCYTNGSLVHYRYGAFRGEHRFTLDGEILNAIKDAQGNLVRDERNAWFSPPEWTVDPFTVPHLADGDSEDAPANSSSAESVLLNNQYIVTEALQHANKGGVYAGIDSRTGNRVVVKEGRPFVAEGRHGDAKARVEFEAQLLRELGPRAWVPKLYEVFEQQGHVFLVEEFIEGEPLNLLAPKGQREEPTNRWKGIARELAVSICELVKRAHEANLLIRDLTPRNLMVEADHQVRLVDFELAHLMQWGAVPDDGLGTPGFSSPEQLAGEPSGVSDDYYSVGSLLAYVATGRGASPLRKVASGIEIERMENWLALQWRQGRVDADIADAIMGCLGVEAARRWRPDRVLKRLRASSSARSATSMREVRFTDKTAKQRVEASVSWLGKMAQGFDPGHLWPTACSGLSQHPANLQSGAAGTGLFLCQALHLLGAKEAELLLRRTVNWVVRLMSDGNYPPGLYFGAAGVAFFLWEAGVALADEGLQARAVELALGIPLQTPNPDICHGIAGIGLLQLLLWERTRHRALLDRSVECANILVSSGNEPGTTVTWGTPAGLDSSFAGRTFLGFAHGIAGIAYFLLVAGLAAEDSSYVAAARSGVDILLSAATLERDAAWWPSELTTGDESLGPFDWPHWCNGSSGVGTALIRFHSAVGHSDARRFAELAARACLLHKLHSSPVQCHGLAGNGEFLFDLWQILGEEHYLSAAWELAATMDLWRVESTDELVLLDETGLSVSAGYNTGLAGSASFLVRLLSGTSRLLMADGVLARDGAPGRDTAPR